MSKVISLQLASQPCVALLRSLTCFIMSVTSILIRRGRIGGAVIPRTRTSKFYKKCGEGEDADGEEELALVGRRVVVLHNPMRCRTCARRSPSFVPRKGSNARSPTRKGDNGRKGGNSSIENPSVVMHVKSHGGGGPRRGPTFLLGQASSFNGKGKVTEEKARYLG
jgi:hypothetical protein